MSVLLFLLLLQGRVLAVSSLSTEAWGIAYPKAGAVVDSRDIAREGMRVLLTGCPKGDVRLTLMQGGKVVKTSFFRYGETARISSLSLNTKLTAGACSLTASAGGKSVTVAFKVAAVQEASVTWAHVKTALQAGLAEGRSLVVWSPYRNVTIDDTALYNALAEVDMLAACTATVQEKGYLRMDMIIGPADVKRQIAVVRDYAKNTADFLRAGEDVERQEMLMRIQRYLAWFGRYDDSGANDIYPGSHHAAIQLVYRRNGVCSAFASLGYAMVEAAGIPVRMKIVEVDGVNTHALLLVQMEDGNWYNLDFTAGNTDVLDPMNPYEQIRLDWFLIGDETVRRSYRWDPADYPAAPQDYPCIWDRDCWMSSGFVAG